MSDTEQSKPEKKKSPRRIAGVIAAAVAVVSLGGYVILSSGLLDPASAGVKEAAAPVALASLMPAQTPGNTERAAEPLQTNDAAPLAAAKADSAEDTVATTDEDASTAAESAEAAAPATLLESHEVADVSTDAEIVEEAEEAVPALAITDLEIEPIDALERGTYKVTGTLANPDSNKKIELTAIKGLLKDKTGATVEEVAFDLPSKRIMEPGGRQDFSYTVVAKEPGIVRLEVAVDLLR